jgi:hypothetical protein
MPGERFQDRIPGTKLAMGIESKNASATQIETRTRDEL